MKADLTFIKSIFSEDDGMGSVSRILMTVIISVILGITISFGVTVLKHHITIEQFDNYLSSAGIFIATTCGPLYGVNKITDVFKRGGNGQDNR